MSVTRTCGRAGLILVTMLAAATAAAVPASAGSVDYAEWTLSDASGTFAVPDTGFPPGSFTSDSTRFQVPSGMSAFLGAATPFGQVFGSSRGHGYLKFGTASRGRPSTTVIRFDSPAPPGEWGFALGDIDADSAKVTATGPGGRALTAADLGWQGAFNYCASSPKPPGCTRPPFTDVPAWNPVTSTLTGNVADTDGAAGWFRPVKPVKSLTVVFSVQSGIPVGQLWLAAKWVGGKPDIVVGKHASPARVRPGGTIRYLVTVRNNGSAGEPLAEFHDDLGDVLDDARYNHDATASTGTVSYHPPVLSWEGHLRPGEAATITYTATVHNPPTGNLVLNNAVIGAGPRITCQAGRGKGCDAEVAIRLPGRNLCRAVLKEIGSHRARAVC